NAMAPIDGVDLTELLGNLLDNARKWASSRVAVTYEVRDGASLLTIDDDGLGVPDNRVSEIAQAGRRLDEGRQGSGLGLAIVGDLAEAYGLAVGYGTSPLGGLRATVTFSNRRN